MLNNYSLVSASNGQNGFNGPRNSSNDRFQESFGQMRLSQGSHTVPTQKGAKGQLQKGTPESV